MNNDTHINILQNTSIRIRKKNIIHISYIIQKHFDIIKMQ